MTSPKRIAANRRNAAQSTAPRTPEGKRRASLNALKHGLRAETLVLPGEDPAELAQLTDEWVAYYQPASPGLRAALDRAVAAQIHLRRSARYLTTTLSEQIRSAQERYDQEQEDAVVRLRALLPTDPEAALKEIRGRLDAGAVPVVADIGTGSGAIAVSVAALEPRLARMYASAAYHL